MQSTNSHADSVRVLARVATPEKRINRYAARYQDAVRRVASRHARLIDLAVSFPGLLFALAVPRSKFDPEPVIQAAIDGVSLKRLSVAAELPLWLRGLGPEAFTRPLGRLPNEPFFRRRVVNHMPRSPKFAPIWLQAVEDAALWGNEDIALWIAREISHDRRSVKEAKLRLVCVWAWFSNREGTIGQSLAGKAWRPSMRFAAADEAAQEWRTNLQVNCDLAGRAVADMWLCPGRIKDLEFAPIATPEEIREEAKAMKNCLRTLSFQIAQNRSRFWSIRRDGLRVATLQIYLDSEDPYPRIGQLKAEANRTAPIEVWEAARLWLQSQHWDAGARPRPNTDYHSIDRDGWIALWRPYWLAKHRLPAWLPLSPSRRVLRML